MTARTTSATRQARWLAWLPLIIAIALLLPTALAQVTVCASPIRSISGDLRWLTAAFSILAFGALCGLIISHQPRNRIGWLCGAISVALAVVAIVPQLFLLCEAKALIALPGAPYLAWLSGFGSLALTLEFLLLPLWFPNGSFLSTGWRRFALAIYSLIVASTLLLAVWPGPPFMYGALEIDKVVDNPFGLPFQPPSGLTPLVQVAGVEHSTLAVVISTLAIAALFTPLRRRIQDWIDRRFFRKKYDAQQVLAKFAQTARDETDLDALLAELVHVVDETLQPERVSIWLKKQ